MYRSSWKVHLDNAVSKKNCGRSFLFLVFHFCISSFLSVVLHVDFVSSDNDSLTYISLMKPYFLHVVTTLPFILLSGNEFVLTDSQDFKFMYLYFGDGFYLFFYISIYIHHIFWSNWFVPLTLLQIRSAFVRYAAHVVFSSFDQLSIY